MMALGALAAPVLLVVSFVACDYSVLAGVLLAYLAGLLASKYDVGFQSTSADMSRQLPTTTDKP